jgi:pimeloyl-ACP methyl ester carboxylesterase
MLRPPLLFIHGAANGAWVWEFWRREMKALGWDANVLDLRGHGMSMPVDFAAVTMEDYVSDVESVTPQLEARLGRQPVLIGWSMGGLVAMMYAAKHRATPALVILEPSPPEQVQGRGTAADLSKMPIAAIGPEAYGLYPQDRERSRAALAGLNDAEAAAILEHSAGAEESGLARRQRKAGISIAAGAIHCPVLLIFGERGDPSAPEVNRRLALFLAAETIAVPAAGHWGLVFSERLVDQTAPDLDAWLRRVLVVE